MKRLSTIIYFLVGVCLLFSCEKEEEIHPKVETLEAIPTSAFSCLFKGTVINTGNSPVLDFGFVYANNGYHSSLSLQSGTKVSLGSDIASAFEKEVSGLAVTGYERNFYVRTYITNERGTVYGSVLTFTLPTVGVQSVFPMTGKAGDLVTISGQNFLTNINHLEVKFNNTTAKIVEATSDKLVVEVPSTINNYSTYYGDIPIYVVMSGQSFTVTSNFRLIALVRDFSPKSGTFGTTLTITGENFPAGSYYHSMSVTIGGQSVSISTMTHSSITVSIPTNITNERLKVIVTVSGQVTELPGEFTIEAPTITDVSPASGLTGTIVTLSGTNFNLPNYYYNSTNTVKFGTTQATITQSTPSSITVTVPNTLTPGSYPLSVFTGVHTVTATKEFVVTAPTISNFMPTSGTAGTEVIINGTFHPFSYNYNTSVKFGTITASVLEVTTTSIKAIVPSYIPAGKTKITVSSGGQTITAADDFEIPAVSLTSFTPASATPGTRVTILGTGFSLDKNYNSVKFGTYNTTIIEANANSLVVLVPSGVNIGAMKISVEVHGQIVTSAQDFVVVNQ
jgi:hypothetical protein